MEEVITPRIRLGKSVSKSVYQLVKNSVHYPIRKSTSKLVYNSIYRSTWRQINDLTRWSVRL
jgi:SMC interacting uncharacterized protein involved in chromosome segregation